jgi:threonine/homoserine/homoserine lactone efflux protein
MGIGLIISLLAAAIVLTLISGPDNLFVLAQRISNLRKSGLFSP